MQKEKRPLVKRTASNRKNGLRVKKAPWERYNALLGDLFTHDVEAARLAASIVKKADVDTLKAKYSAYGKTDR